MKKITTSANVDAYDHAKIEKKWQKEWDDQKLHIAKEIPGVKKFYGLIEFPYPSGEGLHVGHVRSNTAMDIICRKRRREGYNVLYPIGWDAFGLPTENYAIKTGIHPAIVTKNNTAIFRKQLKDIGFSFDWTREVNTSDPAYYRWTQWIFLQFLKKGLAYKKKMTINWCPKDLIGLANEEVINGKCERCGTLVEKREKEQWMLAITKYAERLLNDLDAVDTSDTSGTKKPLLDWPEHIKDAQKNWIGKSEGAHIDFRIVLEDDKNALVDSQKSDSGASSTSSTFGTYSTFGIKVFTTRADTLFGVTYIVIAPEHQLVQTLMPSLSNRLEVESYISKSKIQSEIERTNDEREKTGINLNGVYAINPANNEKVPVWIADYVLADYGTGAVMAVPAHDTRDWDFAKKYGLPIKQVIVGDPSTPSVRSENDSHQKTATVTDNTNNTKAYCEDGTLINSGKFDGKDSESARKEITKHIGGELVTKFKLRDWIFSRQRYWGEPIPVVKCEKCAISNPEGGGWVPVPESDLPVKLPEVKKYQPTETGESPLAAVTKWVNTKCPVCNGPAKRETDTMPNWAGSSWYYLRYTDSENKTAFADKKNLEYWTPVDWYNGGMEHTTLHLLYSRFWHKFLYDLGLVPTIEPYTKRTSHGLILAEGGVKMSKSKGNVVNPDVIVKSVGADTLRVYEMFMGPFDQAISWDTSNIAGSRRFLERVWKLKNLLHPDSSNNSKDVERSIQKTIKKVSDDIENMRFNTAISALMIAVNEMEKIGKISKSHYETLLQLLAPFAPHITEELWSSLGNEKSIHQSPWPAFDSKMAVADTVKIIIQINGKMRGSFMAAAGTSKETLQDLAQNNAEVIKWLKDKIIDKVIVIPDRLVSIVVK
ncbi:MAG: leucine--tRNA ligase [Candidatus Paceibacterota bacterium]|jgi:leucyl-tRNA synthetase